MHIAVVGMGRMGQTHVKSLALNFPDIHLHVVSGHDEGHAYARRFGAEHHYTDLDEALAQVLEARRPANAPGQQVLRLLRQVEK